MIKKNALMTGAIFVIIALTAIIVYDTVKGLNMKVTENLRQTFYIEDKQSEIIIYEDYTTQPESSSSIYTKLPAETSVIKDGIQEIEVTLEPYAYPPLIVQKGIPVKFTITANENNLNSCNNEIVIADYRFSKKLVPGENQIEFTPTEAGVISYSCWMGMINSTISVVDDINEIDINKIKEQIDALPSAQGCCGMIGRLQK